MSVPDVDDYVSNVLCRVPGVLAARTHYTRKLYKDGSSWSLDALRGRQRQQVEKLRGRLADAPQRPTPVLLETLDALMSDVRRPASSIATELGRSVASVSRAIHQLMHVEWVRTRVEVAHDRVGWDTTAVLWFSVPHARVTTVAAEIAKLPQVRLCAGVLGPANVMAIVWLRDFDELDQVETGLARAHPDVQIVDRWMIPRVAKRMGHLISPDGRRTGYVPLTRWFVEQPGTASDQLAAASAG
jgi:DNA-binding Lrp family transcriptional regulator